MEKLTKEHDGFYRTPSGFAAVVPKTASGRTADGSNYFEFKVSALADIIRVEWPAEAPLALLDNDVAVMLVRVGYAVHPSEALVAEYNELVAAAVTPTPTAAATPKAGKGKAATVAAPQGDSTAGHAPIVSEGGVPFPPEGWAVHPTTAGWYYKDQEVLSEADLRAKVGA